jgi:Outer membrane protein beta-barrel domain
MKGHLGLHVAAFLTLCVPGAWAQSPTSSQPVSRVDVTGIVAWLNADRSEFTLDRYNTWDNRVAFGGAGVGWYWTDNLKTEFDGGISSRVTHRVNNYTTDANRTTIVEGEYRFATRRVGLAQHYQFGRNAWFHPWVSAGVDFTWEQIDETEGPIHIIENVTHQNRTEPGEGVLPRRTEFTARPFGALGFKTYMAPRTFFRTDMKFVFHGGVDEVLLRFGIGVDF